MLIADHYYQIAAHEGDKGLATILDDVGEIEDQEIVDALADYSVEPNDPTVRELLMSPGVKAFSSSNQNDWPFLLCSPSQRITYMVCFIICKRLLFCIR